MGIGQIHILINPDSPDPRPQVLVVQYLLAEAHRRGEHAPGEQRQNCPLCQLGK